MLDFLVRVSSRAGWITDRVSLTLTCRRLSQSQPSQRSPGARQASPPESNARGKPHCHTTGRSTVPQRPSPKGYNSRRSRRTDDLSSQRPYHRRRTGRDALPTRKVHSRESGLARSESQGSQNHASRRSQKLNSEGRLDGSTRLPLDGFTYS